MREIDAASKHLYDTLTGDTALAALIGDRVYEREAPADATYPFIVFSLYTSSSLKAGGKSGRLLVYPRWLVYAFLDRNDLPAAREVLSAADDALTDSTGTVTLGSETYYVQTVAQDGSPPESGGTVDGNEYCRAGAFYTSPVHSV